MQPQQRKICDGPVRVKALRFGWAVGVIMIHWGVSPCCSNPPVAKVTPPQRRKYIKKYDQIAPSSSHASPTLWGNHCGSDNRDCHTHTTSRNHCAKAGRNTIGIWPCTRLRHRDCVDMPDAGLHPHSEAMHKQHTEPGPSCYVCPSVTHMSTK